MTPGVSKSLTRSAPDLARRAANRALQLRTALWEDRAFKKQEGVVASGTVKWFNPTKGYGFIQPSSGGGKDVFVHISAVEKAGLSTLNDGQQVEYDLVANKGKESRFRKSAQDDKWSFCLTVGTLCPANQERP